MLEATKSIIRSSGPLYRAINRARGFRISEPDVVRDAAVLGEHKAAWGVILGRLDGASIVYSAGVGQEISFDEELIARVGCEVHALDPTPTAGEWLRGRRTPPEFKFLPLGLADRDGFADFHLPRAVGGASYSAQPDPSAAQHGAVACEVMRLGSLMRRLGHARVDLLKMDIEGFEYGVVGDIIESALRPGQLLVEYHHQMYGIGRERTLASVRRLRDYGYGLFWVSDGGHEYGFCDLRA